MSKRVPHPRWERVPGSYKSVKGLGREFVRECANCKRTGRETETPTTMECSGCGSHFYELALPPSRKPKAPKPTPQEQTDAKSSEIAKRLKRARLALDAAVTDALIAADRIKTHRAKISRLEAALRTPAEVRSARARKALETRSRPKRRAMAIGGQK